MPKLQSNGKKQRNNNRFPILKKSMLRSLTSDVINSNVRIRIQTAGGALMDRFTFFRMGKLFSNAMESFFLTGDYEEPPQEG